MRNNTIGVLKYSRKGFTVGKEYRLYGAGGDYVYVFDDCGHRVLLDDGCFELHGEIQRKFNGKKSTERKKKSPTQKQADLFGFRTVKDYRRASEMAGKIGLSTREYIKRNLSRDGEGFLVMER